MCRALLFSPDTSGQLTRTRSFILPISSGDSFLWQIIAIAGSPVTSAVSLVCCGVDGLTSFKRHYFLAASCTPTLQASIIVVLPEYGNSSVIDPEAPTALLCFVGARREAFSSGGKTLRS